MNTNVTDHNGALSKLWRGLRKTRAILNADIGDLLSGKKAIDAEALEVLEERLLLADVGIETTQTVVEALSKRISYGEIADLVSLRKHLAALLTESLQDETKFTPPRDQKPCSILVVGVNGSGKTTSIGKLAYFYKQQGYRVMLSAGDTFRAAAVEQLQSWGARNAVTVIAQGENADPAAVSYDALHSAIAKKADILLADTAGRLHTQNHLMEELKKIKRVMQKLDAQAPHETWLVVDAGIGQNALQQAKQFHAAIGLSGLVLTKLDGSAKGGIVFAIKRQLQLPIRFIGTGEQIDDLQPFSAPDFVQALLQDTAV